MDSLLVILRKSPYGTVDAAEAVRHAGGASGFDYKAMLYLIDSGVYSAKKRQDTVNTGFTGVGESLELLSDEMEIYVHKDSLNEYGLKDGSTVYHIDLYRLEDVDEVFNLGIEEYLYSGNYCFIEWPQILMDYIDSPYHVIHIDILENNSRKIALS